MSQSIIKLGNKYIVWSSIVDAPITYGLTLDQLRDWIKDRYGRMGLEELPERLKRVEEKGTSSYEDDSVDSIISCNRAGPNEECLTKEQIVDQYVNRNYDSMDNPGG